jgi:uncharacterized protein
MLDSAITDNRTNILHLARKHGIHNVRVFGSMANGSATLSSDVDLLVDLEEGYDLFDLGACLMDLQDLLHRKIDMVTKDALNPRIREKVLKEAVPL